MFDIGFWEVVLIGLVALIVFGPEKLPKLVREVTFWLRKARKVMASAKSEIDQELKLYELQQSYADKRKSFEREVDLLNLPSVKRLDTNVFKESSEVSESRNESK